MNDHRSQCRTPAAPFSSMPRFSEELLQLALSVPSRARSRAQDSALGAPPDPVDHHQGAVQLPLARPGLPGALSRAAGAPRRRARRPRPAPADALCCVGERSCAALPGAGRSRCWRGPGSSCRGGRLCAAGLCSLSACGVAWRACKAARRRRALLRQRAARRSRAPAHGDGSSAARPGHHGASWRRMRKCACVAASQSPTTCLKTAQRSVAH